VAYDAGVRAAPDAPVPIAIRGLPIPLTVTESSNVTEIVTREPVLRVPELGEAVTPVTFAGMRTNASEVVRTYVPITDVEIANCPSELESCVAVTDEIGV
jgi:hypothetical protein